MRSNLRVSKHVVLTTGALIAGCIVSWLIHSSISNERLGRQRALRREVQALKSQRYAETRDELSQSLELLRSKAAGFRMNLMGAHQAEEFLQDWAAPWVVTREGEEITSEYRKIRCSLSLEKPPISAWAEIAGTVRQIQARQGVRLKSLDIRATGPQEQRTFDSVTLSAVLFVRLEGTAEEKAL